MTPEFRSAMLSVKGADIDYAGPLAPGGGLDVDGPETPYMPCELQRLFAYMGEVDVQALSTKALTRSFGWTGEQEQVQHDAHELCRFLFESIENHMPEQGGKIIPKLYKGKTVNEVPPLHPSSSTSSQLRSLPIPSSDRV